jgi:hypothetical protein
VDHGESTTNPATQRPEVDSLITGTGLQYAEAGVEAKKRGRWKKPPMGDGCDPRVILTVLVVDALSSLGELVFVE